MQYIYDEMQGGNSLICNRSARTKSAFNIKYKLKDIILHSGDFKLNVFSEKLVRVTDLSSSLVAMKLNHVKLEFILI